MNKLSLGIFTLLVLLGGLGLGLVLVSSSQDIRGRAAGTEFLQTSPNADSLNKTDAHDSSVSYISDTYSYTITADKNYWTETQGIAEGNTNTKQLFFNLNELFGRAEVSFIVHDEIELQAALDNQKPAAGSDELDILAAALQISKKANLPAGVTIAKAERINKAGKDAYKFTYEEAFLRSSIQYYEYIYLQGSQYYEVMAKYPAIPASMDLAEEFIESISFSSSASSVKGAADTKEMNTRQLDETKIVELTNPSVVNIVNVTCSKINMVKGELYRYLKPSYSFCTGGKGSGFMISKDGYIGTNGHVAKIHPEEAFLNELPVVFSGGSPGLRSFLVDLYRLDYLQYYQKEISVEKAEKNMKSIGGLMWAVGIISMFLENDSLVFDVDQNKYFVKLGDEPIAIDKEKVKKGDYLGSVKTSKTVKEAALVDYEFPNNFKAEILLKKKVETTGTDVGILKIDNRDKFSYPGLAFGDLKKAKEGNSLVVIGYPGLVEGEASASSLLSFKSSANPTVSRGIISSIKTDQDGRTLVQTDASIEQGNSGGPAFDNYGKVLGIATYAVKSDSGNYNFLRDIADLQGLMKKNKIATDESPAYKAWYTGLSYFWDGYYRKAIREFKTVKELYPSHPSVANYITESEAAIKDGRDKDGVWGTITDTIPWPLLIAIPALFLLIGSGGIAFLIIKKKKQNTGQPPPQAPEQPAGPEVNPLQQYISPPVVPAS